MQFVKQEDVNKYRCKVPECTKLFKGVEFWRKHIEKRHTEWYDKIRSDVELVNVYVLDPAHIAPSRSDANSNGHFPLGNNSMMGTPRGFNLNQHIQSGGFPVAVGVPGNAMGPMFPNQMAAMPGWGPMPNMAAMPSMQGGVGPVRNTGRHAMNGMGRMPGPYARNDGRGRQPSMSGGRGAVPPFMGITGLSSEGGVGAIGPNEAVQGRSLKSYEDLDAAVDKSQGTGELDY